MSHTCTCIYICVGGCGLGSLKLVIPVRCLECIVAVDLSIEFGTKKKRAGHLAVEGVTLVRGRSQTSLQ